MGTVQLRRYRIAPGRLGEFEAWFRRSVVTRYPFGFSVLFAFADDAAGEFVWAVAHDGDAAEFDQAEARWRASPERVAAFAGQPDCLLDHHVTKVRPVLT